MKSKKIRMLKTVTISLPVAMGKQIEEDAYAEHRTVSEFMRELYRQYKSRKIFSKIAKKR